MVAASVVFVTFIESAILSYVGLNAKYWFYTKLFCFFVEKFHAKHVPMVGNGNGIHSFFCGRFKKPCNARGSIKNGVLGMYV